MEFDNYMYQSVDKDFVETIVGKLKSQGIFDQFRKDCLADVDTKPAYQNLQERVNGTVNTFLEKHKWQQNLNKTQLRESLRRHVQQGFLETGVDRIVDQVVNPKIYTVFKPKVEDVVYDTLGLQKPSRSDKERNLLNFIMKHPPPPHPPPPLPPPPVTKDSLKTNVVQLEDLLPKDLDPISPGSVDDLTFSPKEEDPQQNKVDSSTNNNDSSAFELIGTEISNDESKLSLSDLTSHDSTKNSVQTPVKTDGQFNIETTTNSIELNGTNSLSPFKNFSNLNEKIKQAEIKLSESELAIQLENSEAEIVCKQDSSEQLDKEESSSFKIHSEDSLSSVSSISREKKIDMAKPKEEQQIDQILNDSQKSDKDKIEECDSGVSNIDKVEFNSEDTEKKEEKHEKKCTESSSSRHKSSRHSHEAKRSDKKHRSHDDKSKSSKSDKDRKHHHDDRHKSKSHKERDSSNKESKNKDEPSDNEKHKSSRHRESEDKSDRIKHKESSDKYRDDRSVKGEKTDRLKHKHNEDKHGSIKDKSEVTHADKKYRESDSVSLEMIDKLEDSFKDREEDCQSTRDTETEDKNDVVSEKDSEVEEEKSDKIKIKDEKLLENEGDEKSKENRVKHKETESKQRFDKSSDKSETLERSGKQKDKEERSSKIERNKSKEELDEHQKNDKVKNKDNRSKHSSDGDFKPSSTKEEKSKNDEKDTTDKEKSRKHGSDKTRSRHSSSSSNGKHKSDKEEKKDKESRKRKGERCEEIKVKESRRSSDRDHNGPGSSFFSTSSSGNKTKDSSNLSNSHNKINEVTNEGSSTVEENNESVDLIEQPNDVDILLMRINDSIENDMVENNRNEEKTPIDIGPPIIKKPKIANNIFEIKKIMQARRNIEKMESLENNAIRKEITESGSNQITEVEPIQTLPEDLKEAEGQDNTLETPYIEDSLNETAIEDNAGSITLMDTTDTVEDSKDKVFLGNIIEEDTHNKEIETGTYAEYETQNAPVVPPEKTATTISTAQTAESNFIKKHRIANNIYEVRKIMHMKKRLQKKQMQTALLLEEKQNSANENHEVKSAEVESLMVNNKDCDISLEEVEEKQDISRSDLANNQDIAEVIEECKESSSQDSHDDFIVEDCPGDNAENEEPLRLKTPRIARNIHEVRKIIRARKALKRKLKVQMKNVELNIARKHMKLLNTKKLIQSKRKVEQVMKLKLINKERRNRLRKDNTANNSRKVLNVENKENNEIHDEIVGDSDVINGSCETVRLNDDLVETDTALLISTDRNQSTTSDNNTTVVEEIPENGFFGFTKHELDLARIQYEKIKQLCLLTNISTTFTFQKTKNNENLLCNEEEISVKRDLVIVDHHDQVIRDILNGKNGCSIKLTKSACLDERAKIVSKYKTFHKSKNSINNNNNNYEKHQHINFNLDESSTKVDQPPNDDQISVNENVIEDNLMENNDRINSEESFENAENISNCEENIETSTKSKVTKSKPLDVSKKNKKVLKADVNFKTKLRNSHNNQIKSSDNETGIQNQSASAPVKNVKDESVMSAQEDKLKPTSRSSTFRSTQRYDSADLYKPRLRLSISSTRTRYNRDEPADNSTMNNNSSSLTGLRRKVR